MQDLTRAAIAGDVEAVRLLIQKDPGALNRLGLFQWGNTTLYEAARAGQLAVVDLLLNLGGDPQKTGHWGWGSWADTPWQAALAADKPDILFRLIQEGQQAIGPISRAQADRLYGIALEYDRVEMLPLLERYFWCSIQQWRDAEGNHPIHVAAMHGAHRVVEYALQEGDTINALNDYRETPLAFLLHGDKPDPTMITALLDRGAQVLNMDYQDANFLHLVAQAGLKEYLDLAMASILAAGKTINDKNQQGRSPLALAAQQGHTEAVAWLLEKGAFVHSRDQQYKTPLLLAVENGHFSCIAPLQEYGANMRVVDARGRHPLYYAALSGDVESFDFLIGQDLLDMPRRDYNTNNTLLHAAALGGNEEILFFLLRMHLLPVDTINRWGETPLMICIKQDNPKTALLLFKAGISWSAPIDDINQAAAAAYQSHRFSLLEYALSQGASADILLKGWCTQSALIRSVIEQDEKMVDLLLAYHADLAFEDDAGHPATYYAYCAHNMPLLERLLRAGASSDIELGEYLQEHRLALNDAIQKGDQEMIRLLESYGAHPDFESVGSIAQDLGEILFKPLGWLESVS